MLALCTCMVAFLFLRRVILYRISAGCCSIIAVWAFADALRLIIDDEPALFLCLDVTKAGFVPLS